MRGRRGVALVLAVLLGLGVIGLAHGLLVLAREELLAARAGRDLLLASVARDRLWHAWRIATQRPGLSPRRLYPDSTSSPPVGGVVFVATARLPGPLSAEMRARRLSEELWWLEIEGRARRVTDRTGRVVRQLDVDAEIAKVGSAVETLRPVPVIATGAVGPVCPTSWRGPRVEGVGRLPDDTSRWLRPEDVTRWAPLITVVRGPVGSLGTAEPCGEGWNWGASSSPHCSIPGVARYAPNSLRLEGGEGTAALFVRGDLELVGTTLRGHVVVGGALSLSGGARLVGLARVGDSVHVAPGSTVTGSLCWAREALRRSRASAPHPLSESGWMRPVRPW
ncbi:MAG: hypothetical protein AAF389_18290 [Gemmatimonadota bacterium]